MNEVWKPVVGREDEYEVSNMGRVRSLDRERTQPGRYGGFVTRKLKGDILKIGKFPNGYLGLHLGRGKCYMVHRLVAEAFIEGASDTLQVNHLNCKRDDNRAENLEWVTCGDNHRHAHKKQGRKTHVWTKAVRLSKDGGVTEFPSLAAAAKQLGVNEGSISSALHRNHKCRGYGVAV